MKNIADANNWKSILVAIIALVVDALIFNSYMTGSSNFAFFALMQTCVLGALLWFVYLSHQKKEDLRYPFLLLLAVFGTGPLGAAGFLLLSIIYPMFSYFSTPPETWFLELFPEEKTTPFANIYQRVSSGWDDYHHMNEVATFRDLFIVGSLSQKQAVLDAVVQDFTPDYAPILRAALEDPHNSVRIQAAAIMSKLDKDFYEELAVLVDQNKKTPHDPEVLLNLAHHYDSYATMGILDHLREKEVGELTIATYKEYLELDPDERRVWFSIGRLLFRMGEYDRFLLWSTEYRRKFVHFPSIIKTWTMNALYKLRRYDDLAAEMKER